MEITGKVIALLSEQTGNGKNGTWRKREFILETSSKYPKKVCISVWGDKIEQFNLKEGQTVTASIELESREYNGRWYTDVRAWKLGKSESAPTAVDVPATVYSKAEMENPGTEDDVPF